MEPHRYKNYWGGRGGAKSWSFARALTSLAAARPLRILCTREYQSSIRDSVHKILSDQIYSLGLSQYYDITRDSLKSQVGSEFIFKGLQHSTEIKSTEGVDICWVEEAQSVSEESWKILIPTIRKPGSEIWMSWNTGEEEDPTYQRFVTNPPDDMVGGKVGWQDNPWFPEVLELERLYLLRVDPDAYDHIWEGNPKKISEACIFKGKFVVDEFEAPHGTRFYYGGDHGFSNDPATLIRCFIKDRHLYIDYEAYDIGVELDDLPKLYEGGTSEDGKRVWEGIPDAKLWPIRFDNSRPETISHVKRKGFRAESCLKWPAGPGKKGSVIEGIEFIRKFEKIHIHQRCKHTAQEFKLYSYKVDKLTGAILPLIVDKHNHCIDALRYSLDRMIHAQVSFADII
jgi:phage terminase large subunit